MLNRNTILKKLEKSLSPERFQHTLGVEKTAVKLAQQYGISVKSASLAALLHDYARKYSSQQLLQQAKKHKLKIGPLEKFEPKLLHAELSAVLAQKDFGIKSKPILSAIAKHTLGSPKMTTLEKIIYLADHIEEGRQFKGVNKIRKIAFNNLDRAIVESASNMLKFLTDNSLPVDPRTIKTRNYYLLSL
ncbi:hypothetical protein A2291_02385 [candidate division WOR-1 bacterium RIFOXYB2_FULL_42_35]|uniref:bis(5'-nucleosyl)-tetraphosphatase (symmetrical) n=1 Tax=candidate division WOR-1 bacterium RIFOXYC2_FULL_41_25 TaxID=1802586 RepID=A0A1F4TP35_UNCSA|nr:MAG: hypothetical protein A2247_05290 [candidate division WOR-1 bacterium RIFOXYA2_FULL_41_14]OGC25074.1 MAG: hypothetical protein A2291_02385 [candidate division WOR-1 bacterium RIFOXYB2_FULL_42_35]OGC34474.1 MAG: hypothetical protein A2462_04205 [candidate division WOR-1 bacterium RIFOXYC2_FULL_41_25]